MIRAGFDLAKAVAPNTVCVRGNCTLECPSIFFFFFFLPAPKADLNPKFMCKQFI